MRDDLGGRTCPLLRGARADAGALDTVPSMALVAVLTIGILLMLLLLVLLLPGGDH